MTWRRPSVSSFSVMRIPGQLTLCETGRMTGIWPLEPLMSTLGTTKHPTSIMSLGFVASDGKKTPLIWFPIGHRLTAADYVKVLDNLVPWVQTNYPDMNVVFQQDGAPAHTSKKPKTGWRRTSPFWPRNNFHLDFSLCSRTWDIL